MNRINQTKELKQEITASLGPRLMSLLETAKYLNVSYWHVRELIDKGKLPKVQLGRRVLIDISDADKLIEESKDRNI